MQDNAIVQETVEEKMVLNCATVTDSTESGEKVNKDCTAQAVATTIVGENGAATEDAAEVNTNSAAVQDVETNGAAKDSPQVGSDEWFEQDRRAWDEAHGDIDKQALFADEDFVTYADGKIGVMSLCEIYDGYCKLRDKWLGHRLAKEEAVQAARKQSPGSLSRPTQDVSEFYTMQELRAMSKEAIVQHWDKVQKSLRHNCK